MEKYIFKITKHKNKKFYFNNKNLHTDYVCVLYLVQVCVAKKKYVRVRVKPWKPNLDLSLSLSLPSKVLRIAALRLQQKRCTVSSLVANYYHLVLVLAVAYKYVQDLQYVCITCRFPLFLQVKKLPPQKHKQQTLN